MALAEVPTAVEACDAIHDWLGRDGVFMKRDDLVSRLYGGNKVRRYEFVLADAKERGAKRIVTLGGLASSALPSARSSSTSPSRSSPRTRSSGSSRRGRSWSTAEGT